MPAFTDLIDLASERLGGSVSPRTMSFSRRRKLSSSRRRLNGAKAFTPSAANGWTDGKRAAAAQPGHDWAIIRLGAPGIVRGVVIDTTFFTGNYPERASIDAHQRRGNAVGRRLAGSEREVGSRLLTDPISRATRRTSSVIDEHARVTHLRLNIFPDGGVARLRVHGDVVPDERVLQPPAAKSISPRWRTAALSSRAATCTTVTGRISSSPAARRTWATAGRRSADAAPGTTGRSCGSRAAESIERVELDTDHFKGNAPGSACSKSPT